MGKLSASIVQFKGENYTTWKERVRDFLDIKNLLDIIDNEVPPTQLQTSRWILRNKKARFYIKSLLDDTFVGRYTTTDGYARSIMEKLDSVFMRSSHNSQITITSQIMAIKAEKGEEMKEYFARFDDILDKLILAGGEMSEILKITCLTRGLPQGYDHAKNTIRGMKTVTMEEVRNPLLETEDCLKASPDTSQKALMTSRPSETQQQNPRKLEVNTRGRGKSFRGHGYYNNRGHKNFKTQRGRGGYYNSGRGYYNNRGRGSNTHRGFGAHHNYNRGGYNKGGSDQKCTFCERYGHRREECRHFQRESENNAKKRR